MVISDHNCHLPVVKKATKLYSFLRACTIYPHLKLQFVRHGKGSPALRHSRTLSHHLRTAFSPQRETQLSPTVLLLTFTIQSPLQNCIPPGAEKQPSPTISICFSQRLQSHPILKLYSVHRGKDNLAMLHSHNIITPAIV